MIESPNIARTAWAPSSKSPATLLVPIVALLAVVVAGAWFAIRHFTSTPSSPKPAAVVAVSEDGLKTMAGAVDRPIYWAGQRERRQV